MLRVLRRAHAAANLYLLRERQQARLVSQVLQAHVPQAVHASRMSVVPRTFSEHSEWPRRHGTAAQQCVRLFLCHVVPSLT